MRSDIEKVLIENGFSKNHKTLPALCLGGETLEQIMRLKEKIDTMAGGWSSERRMVAAVKIVDNSKKLRVIPDWVFESPYVDEKD